MKAVMSNLERISKFLSRPVAPLLFLDYMLPKTPAKYVKKLMTKMGILDTSVHKHRPCKIIIMVNGLRQCSPEKVSEVINALTLLSSLPCFIIYFGANSDVLQSALSVGGTSKFRDTYDKLNHWVQVPFAVPRMSATEKHRVSLNPPSMQRSGAKIDTRKYATG